MSFGETLAGPSAGTPVILNADDYGLAPGVSRAIRELVAAGRVSATSCMTGIPGWPEEAQRLSDCTDTLEVGVHLTLTDQPAVAPMPSLAPDGRLPPLGQLMKASFRRALPLDEIAAELGRQLDAFESAFGRPPDFLDGHQHVHQLPGVRRVVLDLARRRLPPTGYVRCCNESALRLLARREALVKTVVLSLLGAGFPRSLRKVGVASNHGFSGVYDFTDSVPFGERLRRFLTRARPGTLIMCHPGYVDEELCARDTVTDQRERELAFLGGPEFPALLESAGCRLARGRELLSVRRRSPPRPR